MTFFIKSLYLEYNADMHNKVFWINKLALVYTNSNIYLYFYLAVYFLHLLDSISRKMIFALMFHLVVVVYYMFFFLYEYIIFIPFEIEIKHYVNNKTPKIKNTGKKLNLLKITFSVKLTRCAKSKLLKVSLGNLIY